MAVSELALLGVTVEPSVGDDDVVDESDIDDRACVSEALGQFVVLPAGADGSRGMVMAEDDGGGVGEKSLYNLI